jgi:hypothetical protein
LNSRSSAGRVFSFSSSAASRQPFRSSDIQVLTNPLVEFPASTADPVPINVALALQESLLATLRYGIPGRELDKLRGEIAKWQEGVKENEQQRRLLLAAQCRVANSVIHRVGAIHGALFGFASNEDGYVKMIMGIHRGVQQAHYSGQTEMVEELRLVTNEVTTEVLKRGFGTRWEKLRRLPPIEMRNVALSVSTALQDPKLIREAERLRSSRLQNIQEQIEKHDLIQSELMIPTFDKVGKDLNQAIVKEEYEGFMIIHAGILDNMWDPIAAQTLAVGMQGLMQRLLI